MRPISLINKKNIYYTRIPGLQYAQRFDNHKNAVEVCKGIRQVYGNDVHLEIINDPPAQGEWDQKRLDRFLPHWAYAAKYLEPESNS